MLSTHPTMPAHARTYSTSSVTSNAESTRPSASNEDNLFGSLGSSFDDLNEDDEDLSYDDDALNADGDDVKPATKSGKKVKLPPSTAEKKATHNAVERARRESLNGRFLVLADMLPGMNHVKRASKAAIVNKSIDLIRNLRSAENKLAKENETLKEELAALRQRLAGAATTPAAAAVSANPAPAPTVPAMFAFPHPAGYPVMPGMPGAAALNGVPPHMQQQFHQMAAAQQQVQMAQFAQAQAHAAAAQAHVQHLEQAQRSASVASSSNLNNGPNPMAAYPGVFNGFFNPVANGSGPFLGNTSNEAENAQSSSRKGTGSPETVPAIPTAANSYFGGEMWSAPDTSGKMSRVDSPTSYSSPSTGHGHGNKDGSHGSHGSAPSPASSQSYSISTPLSNAYSPLPSSAFAAAAAAVGNHAFNSSSSNGANNAGPTGPGLEGTSPANPAIAAFDSTSDPMFLATHFSTHDLVKAQTELSAFIAYQQRLSGNNGSNNGPATGSSPVGAAPPTPSTPAFAAPHNSGGFPDFHAHQQQQHLQNGNGNGNGNQAMPNIPAWQMMMAQQQALTSAAYGQTAY